LIYVGRQQFGGINYTNSAYIESASYIERSIITIYSEVKSIKEHCFKDASDLISVSLPNCLTLGNAPFLGCTNLETVKLPNVNKLTQEFLFINSPNLKDLDMSGLTTISGCLANCFGYINNMVTLNLASMDTNADLAGHFANLSYLTDINLASMTNVGNSDYMFYGDTNLVNAEISNIKRINSCVSLWENCINIKDINTPFLTDLGNCHRIFANCSNLENIVLSNLTNMGNAYEAIVDCNKLPGLVLSNLRNVDAHSGKIVDNCANMVMVCLPNLSNVNTTEFNTVLFQNVPNVKYINIPQINSAINVFNKSIYLNTIEVNFASAKYFDGTFENNNLLGSVNLSSLQNTWMQNKMFYGTNSLTSLNLCSLNNITQSSDFINCDHKIDVNIGNNKNIQIINSSNIFTNTFVTGESINIQPNGSYNIFENSELNIPNLEFYIQKYATNLLHNTNASKTNITLSGNFAANYVYISNSQTQELRIREPYDYITAMFSDVKSNYLYLAIENHPYAFSNLMNSTNVDIANVNISLPVNSNNILNIAGIKESISNKLNVSNLVLSSTNNSELTKLAIYDSTNAFVGLNLNLQNIYDISLINSSCLFDSNSSNYTNVINNITEINNCNNLFYVTNFNCSATTTFDKAKTIRANNLFYGTPDAEQKPSMYITENTTNVFLDTPFTYGTCQSSYIGISDSDLDNFVISNITNLTIDGSGDVKTIAISNVTGTCNLNNINFVGTNIKRLENTYINTANPILINIANMRNVVFNSVPNFNLLNRIEDDACDNVIQNGSSKVEFNCPYATYIGNGFNLDYRYGTSSIPMFNMPNVTYIGYNCFNNALIKNSYIYLNNLTELHSNIQIYPQTANKYELYMNSLSTIDSYFVKESTSSDSGFDSGNFYLQNVKSISNINFSASPNYYLGNLNSVTNCVINIPQRSNSLSTFFGNSSVYYYNTYLGLYSGNDYTINCFKFGTNLDSYSIKTNSSSSNLIINTCIYDDSNSNCSLYLKGTNIGNLEITADLLGNFSLTTTNSKYDIYAYINNINIYSTAITGTVLLPSNTAIFVENIYANYLTEYDAERLKFVSRNIKTICMRNVTKYISNAATQSPFPLGIETLDIGVAPCIPDYFFESLHYLTCMPQFTSNVYLNYIGNHAFIGIYVPIDVNIQANYIGNSAFFGSNNITGTVNLSAITTIGERAFANQNKLTSTGNLAHISEIQANTFHNCSNMVFDGNFASASNIGANAFYNCSNMTGELQIRPLHDVSNYAFYNCNNLTSFNGNVSNLTGNIGEYAFYNCQNLFSEANFSCVSWIGSHAFANCKSLTNIRIENIVGNVLSNQHSNTAGIFEGCSNLSYCWCHDNIQLLPPNMFSNCVNLTHVRVEGVFKDWEVAYVSNLGAGAFDNCHSLQVFNCTQLWNIQQDTFNNCWSLSNLVSISNIRIIGENAFAYCNGHTNYLGFGANVEEIHTNAFDNCINLPALDFSNSTKVPILNGVLWTTAPTNVEIRVPASLYDSWKTAANWSQYANLMVSV
jgi:hypothetical protein